MANKNARLPENQDGKYYVDDQCIGCNACVTEAPNFFKMGDTSGHAFVYKQPQSAEDIKICQNAITACPVEAIGNDG